MNLKKKLERYLRVNFLGTGPKSYKKKKNLPGCGLLTEVEKHWHRSVINNVCDIRNKRKIPKITQASKCTHKLCNTHPFSVSTFRYTCIVSLVFNFNDKSEGAWHQGTRYTYDPSLL